MLTPETRLKLMDLERRFRRLGVRDPKLQQMAERLAQDALRKAEASQPALVTRLVREGKAGWVKPGPKLKDSRLQGVMGSVLVNKKGCLVFGFDGKPVTDQKRPAAAGIDLPGFRGFVVRQEGKRAWMYLDTGGNVTIGIGHLIEDLKEARKLSFFAVDEAGRRMAGRTPLAQIENAYERVKRSSLRNDNEGQFAKVTRLRIDEAEIARLFQEDVKDTVDLAKDTFLDIATFPREAQRGILDLIFNLGEKRFEAFVKFRSAVFRRDWRQAGLESNRAMADGFTPGGLLTRNAAVKALFEEAARREPFFIAKPECRADLTSGIG